MTYFGILFASFSYMAPFYQEVEAIGITLCASVPIIMIFTYISIYLQKK
jgi:hypothetical protein